MNESAIGVMIVGACGSVSLCTLIGATAQRLGLADETGMVSALPHFSGLDLPDQRRFVFGGWEIRSTTLAAAALVAAAGCDRRLDTGDSDVEVTLALVDLDGTPGIVAAESFDVEVHFTDVREPGAPLAVTAGYADVRVDPALLRVDGIDYDSDYDMLRSGDVDNDVGLVDEVIIVDDPARDLERALGTVNHFGVPALVCINKYDVNPDRSREIADFCTEQGIEVVGQIPFDTVVTEAMVRGLPVTDFGDGAVSRELRRMWARIKEG